MADIDVMLDLETWGTKPGCAIRSIGAVVFDPRGTLPLTPATFYRNILDESCLSIGLVKDPGTVEWWSRQSREAQDALLKDQVHVGHALTDFADWFRGQRANYVWAQGSNFDPGLVEHIFDLIGVRCPWKFFNTQDTRTAYRMGGLDTRTMPRAGTYHNALDDAIHQAKCVQEAHRRVS